MAYLFDIDARLIAERWETSMQWSLTLGRFGGTAIRVHVTFLLLLVWLGAIYYQQGGPQAAIEGVIFIALLFLCVLLHELGHVYAARRYGIETRDVTLWFFGGIASLERIPERPGEEFVIAIAGPLVNVVIAAALILFLGARLDPEDLGRLQDPTVSMVAKLAAANVFLVLFNLIPAFPMDGGRVLRAILATRMSHARATQWAATVGQAFAVAFGIFGIFTGNVTLMVIAVFVFLAASGEASYAQLRAVTRGNLVADAMITKFESLSTQATVNDAIECLIRTTQKDFPVLDGAGRLRGVVTRDGMIKALKDNGPQQPVLQIMETDIPTVALRANLDSAVKALTEQGKPVVAVTDNMGHLIGLLTAENLGEMMMVQAAAAHPSSLRRPAGA
jgi:Zn-dependent protease/CBS domain-containing protein